ncbi:MAG: glycosyltransferase, partial [Microbacteriaceae bacterium]|nr:glycosyltransferase [Microbacteriaceae bacterium]
PVEAEPGAAPIAAGDTVLILGKPWDDAGLQARLDAEKATVGFRIVELVYDLVPSLVPHLHHPSLTVPYTRQMFRQAQTSDRLLAISESSRRDYEEFCRRLALPCPPIDVIRIADRLGGIAAAGRESDALPAGVDEAFMLCVGTVEVRKNHALLYAAVKLAAERGIPLPQLVIVGGHGWLVDETWNNLTRDPAVRDSIRVLSSVDDELLDRLYRLAAFTVYPSKYEGWGLPVAEALAQGRAVAASSSSSIPEIGGDLVRYFSPYSVDECLEALVELSDPVARAAAEARIRAEYVATSWDDTAAQVRASLAALDR